jgi:predicted RNase H-like HicB family nuclease
MRFQVVLEPSEEGGFTIYVPALPGCISEGETMEEALANIREAIELYLEPVEEGPIPDEQPLIDPRFAETNRLFSRNED